MGNESIKKNMVMNILLTSSNFVLPLITYSYVARVLLRDGTGKVAFVQSILSYFLYIAALGIPGYAVRECAKVRDDKEKLSVLVSELMTIELISTLVSYVILFIAMIISKKLSSYTALILVMSSSIILQTIGMEWLYNALEKYTYISIRSILFKLIAVVLTFAFVQSKEDILLYGAITVFSTSASYILNFVNSRKYIHFRRVNIRDAFKHFHPVMVFFMSTIIITVYANFDTLMLGFIKNDGEVGIYNAAMKMKSVVISLSTAVTSVLIPRMSVYFSNKNMGAFTDLLKKSLSVSMVLMLPMAIFVAINASDVLLFVCGPDYSNAKSTLILLMCCCIVLMNTNIIGNQILIPTGKEKRYSQSVFIGMWINLILNSILIPRYASAGAAFATLVTEVFNMCWMGIGCKEVIQEVLNRFTISRYLIPLLVAVGLQVLLRTVCIYTPLLMRLCICGVAFFGAYFFMLILMKEPIICSILHGVKARKK